MRKVCLECKAPFEAREHAQRCSPMCRAAPSRKRRTRALNAALGEIEHGLVKARRVQAGEVEDLS